MSAPITEVLLYSDRSGVPKARYRGAVSDDCESRTVVLTFTAKERAALEGALATALERALASEAPS